MVLLNVLKASHILYNLPNRDQLPLVLLLSLLQVSLPELHIHDPLSQSNLQHGGGVEQGRMTASKVHEEHLVEVLLVQILQAIV